MNLLTRVVLVLCPLVLVASHGSVRVHAVAIGVVISEFRTRGPFGVRDEFIEIRNDTGSPIGLRGWTVTSGDGADFRSIGLSDITLGPGCTWLLGNSTIMGYSGGVVDQTFTGNVNDRGVLTLSEPDGTLHRVGFGSFPSEGTPLPAFPSGLADKSYDRVANTQDNASDFVLISPSTPQRSGPGCVTPSVPSVTYPVISNVTASPSTVAVGGQILVTAAIDPGPDSGGTGAIQVSANTHEFTGNGNNPAMVDDGTNGDAVAGDGVYSVRVTVAADVRPGMKPVTVSAIDNFHKRGTRSPPIYVTIDDRGLSIAPAIVDAVLNSHPSHLWSNTYAAVMVRIDLGRNPTSTGLQVTMDLSALGRSPATRLSDAGGGACDQKADDFVFTACFRVPDFENTPLRLIGVVRDAQGREGSTSITTDAGSGFDRDADGLVDECEDSFGLLTESGMGDNGPHGDPDSDGRTNAQECAAGTHPRGVVRRYLAEGVTNDFFRTRIALFNPSATAKLVLVRVQPEGAPEQSLMVAMPPQQRRTLMPEDFASITAAPFATVVEADSEVVVDRLMTWGTGSYGSHAETSVYAPSTTWFLAEGATGWRFSLFYLLQNPSEQDAQVEVSYLRAFDPVLVRTYTVPARQRRTIPVDDEEFPQGSGMKPLAATDVSASIRVTNGIPIVVERAMYMSPDDQPFGAGHAAAGVPALATHWFFAEGATGSFFDEFLLLANPGDAPATVTITYDLEGGTSLVRAYGVAPRSRRTIWVDQEPGLESASLSASLSSTVPIAAERAMWWPGSGESWREAHVSPGVTTPASRWAIADVELGGPFHAESYVLIANGGTLAVYFDDGSPPVLCGTAGTGRATLRIGDCPGVAGKRFVSVIVDGTSQTIVERALYYSGASLFDAGAAAVASPIPP